MNLPILKLEGRSGCSLEVLDANNNIVVRKFSASISYNVRLIKQAKKQEKFPQELKHFSFKVPTIHQICTGGANELAFFDMDYVPAEKYSDFLERVAISDLQKIIKKLLTYFDYLFSISHKTSIDKAVFTNKCDNVMNNIEKRSDINMGIATEVCSFLSKSPISLLPSGYCHGDFTFSNILFNNEELILLDFLDSFVETPIIDIVKLRQDTLYHWSLLIESNLEQYRKNKIIQIFSYFDGHIKDYIDSKQDIKTWYKYLQVFNLFRILPYVKKEDEISFVEHTLKTLL